MASATDPGDGCPGTAGGRGAALRAAFGAVLVLMLCACAAGPRPAPPAAGAPAQLPEGAVQIGEGSQDITSDLDRGLSVAVDSRFAANLERDENGRPVYRVLALSGGGSRGAYGAGVLVGWTASGKRPVFDVVTGISTGALMATFAFLGPDHDGVLRSYARITNEEVFTPRNAVQLLTADALRDTTPLREKIASFIDERILEAVAAEHAAGRRLFIGTTNLDAGAFTMWDMGQLAAGDRADKLQRYRDIVLASASFPLIFPPVYIPLETGGQTHWQMHVDGSARANVFASTFMLDLGEVIDGSAYGRENVRGELWVIHNGQHPDLVNDPVAPRIMDIAEATIGNLLAASTINGLNELYTLAMLNGFQFYYTAIPEDVRLHSEPLDFDAREMGQLFSLGQERGRSGSGWQPQPPPSEPFELLQILDPAVMRSAHGSYPSIPRRPPRWMGVGPPLEDPAHVSMCTGTPSGNYQRVARDIEERLAPLNITMDIVATSGSRENMRRIRDGSCDAGIAQHDAYFLELYEESGSTRKLSVRRPTYLFDDFVHLVCNQRSGVTRFRDLLQRPQQQRILIGGSDSGSSVTWEVLVRLEPRLAAIPVATVGKDKALEDVAENARPACLLYVASLDTPYMARLDDMSDRLRLVSVDNHELNNARIAGEKIYRYDYLPRDVYPRLQAKSGEEGILSLTVGSSVIVSDDWARKHPRAYRRLGHAVAGTRRDFLGYLTRP